MLTGTAHVNKEVRPTLLLKMKMQTRSNQVNERPSWHKSATEIQHGNKIDREIKLIVEQIQLGDKNVPYKLGSKIKSTAT
jgi:hypothetical protein